MKDLFGPALLSSFCRPSSEERRSSTNLLVLLLRQESGESLLPAFSRNFEFFSAFPRARGFSVLGLALASALALFSARPSVEGFAPASRPFATLLNPCGLTAVAVASLLISRFLAPLPFLVGF